LFEVSQRREAAIERCETLLSNFLTAVEYKENKGFEESGQQLATPISSV